MHKQTQHVSAIKCTRYSKDYTSMSNLHNKTMQHYFCKHIQNENDSKQFASISNITKQCKIICYNSNKTKTMPNNTVKIAKQTVQSNLQQYDSFVSISCTLLLPARFTRVQYFLSPTHNILLRDRARYPR